MTLMVGLDNRAIEIGQDANSTQNLSGHSAMAPKLGPARAVSEIYRFGVHGVPVHRPLGRGLASCTALVGPRDGTRPGVSHLTAGKGRSDQVSHGGNMDKGAVLNLGHAKSRVGPVIT